MRTLHLFILFLCVTTISQAQITCANAVTITTGVTNVSEVISGQVPIPECAENFGQLRTGGRWYTFTATVDGVGMVTSDLSSNPNTDTRLHIYTGDCSTLQCVGGNDDKEAFANNRASEVLWPITNGVTYYIAWDNQWSSDGFNFELTETAVTCPDINGPIASDFDSVNEFVACFITEDTDGNSSSWKLQFIDVNGDNEDEDYSTNGTNSTNAKNDWLFSPPINLISGNQYDINFKYNAANGTFPANENLDVHIVDAPNSSANILATIYSDTNITANGSFDQVEELAIVQDLMYTATTSGTYYLAFNATSPIETGALLIFDFSFTENILGTEEFNNNTIMYTYDKSSESLFIESQNANLSSLIITNMLGQEVLRKPLNNATENVRLDGLSEGIYSLIISSENSRKVVKFLKY